MNDSKSTAQFKASLAVYSPLVVVARQDLPFALTAIRICNELDILRWLGKEEWVGGGIMKAFTTNEGGSLKCYILYGGIRLNGGISKKKKKKTKTLASNGHVISVTVPFRPSIQYTSSAREL